MIWFLKINCAAEIRLLSDKDRVQAKTILGKLQKSAADPQAAPTKQAPSTPPSTHWLPQRNKHQPHRCRLTGPPRRNKDQHHCRLLIGHPKKTSTNHTAVHSLAAPRKQAPTTPPLTHRPNTTKQGPTTLPLTHWTSQRNKHQQHRRPLIGRPKDKRTNHTAADSLAAPRKQAPTTPPQTHRPNPTKQAPTTPPPTHWPSQRNNHHQHRRLSTGRRDLWSVHSWKSRLSDGGDGGEKFPVKH